MKRVASSNTELIYSFLREGTVERTPNAALRVEGDVLYSYRMPIAQRGKNGLAFAIDRGPTVTTGRHISMLHYSAYALGVCAPGTVKRRLVSLPNVSNETFPMPLREAAQYIVDATPIVDEGYLEVTPSASLVSLYSYSRAGVLLQLSPDISRRRSHIWVPPNADRALPTEAGRDLYFVLLNTTTREGPQSVTVCNLSHRDVHSVFVTASPPDNNIALSRVGLPEHSEKLSRSTYLIDLFGFILEACPDVSTRDLRPVESPLASSIRGSGKGLLLTSTGDTVFVTQLRASEGSLYVRGSINLLRESGEVRRLGHTRDAFSRIRKVTRWGFLLPNVPVEQRKNVWWKVTPPHAGVFYSNPHFARAMAGWYGSSEHGFF
jgi:hypothetical protein